MDCGICYAYRLDDETPEKTCDDARCGQTFHTSCLVEVRFILIVINLSLHLIRIILCGEKVYKFFLDFL